ncbi:15-cis-phytoene synthase [Corynebacterium ciconiae DSM 44920]|uniref:phytoene/squalene synthase family protein n=1 Tax=Corynebacterium ciconiae TaxID=227319 RepID=UPI00036277B9|nr:phytoene/squalene synthase family protein [Corynebacterium ciconiae]WKD60682.1 15-cis-phytoene synthase [Corynebacterium ciconiae DSM 44920]
MSASPSDYLRRFQDCADAAARQVIRSYSTSFGLSSRLLAPAVRRDIHNVYAVVRIADEIVDGTAAAAGMSPAEIRAELDRYEAEVMAAPERGFHTDPVLHAYAGTARRCGLKREHMAAFFASMRQDLERSSHTPESLAAYIYGSAEVIGLMCVQIFLSGRSVSPEDRAAMERGARSLGAAFQKINFLRDLSEDSTSLGRAYLGELTPSSQAALITEIRQDLQLSYAAIPLLPTSSALAVRSATDLFAALTEELDKAPTQLLYRQRLRLGPTRKAGIIIRSLAHSIRDVERS